MKPNKYKSKLYRKNNSTCHGGEKGWDYTPLFRYLISKVGCKWDEVYSEIISRLNNLEPIWYIVRPDNSEKNSYTRVGESTYFSTLYVDEEGLLQVVDKNINHTTLEPNCSCCTHTFNGKRFTKRYEEKPILEREFVSNLSSSINI